MSNEVQCPGCAARYRMRIRSGAPARASLACPRCNAVIPLGQRATAAALGTSTAVEAQAPRAGWQAIETSAIFGRPAPPPPVSTTPTRTAAPQGPFSAPQRPRLGLFGDQQAETNAPTTPRLPEADRPDSVRPLASALLRELRQKRSSGAALAERATESPTRVESASAFVDGTSHDQGDKQESVESPDIWIDQDLIDEAVDAADELFVVDDSPPPFDRLPGALLETSEVEEEAIKPRPTPPEPTPPEPAPPEPEGRELQETPVGSFPLEIPVGDEKEQLLNAPETTFRLRIGGKVYGDIDFEGLLELFRRGIWVVADKIAEDDGPWMPIDSHPIFERVRHAIADGLTALLLTHGQLLEERPDDGTAPPSAQSTPTPPTPPQQPAVPPPAPRPVVTHATVEAEPEPQPSVVPVIRMASPTLPWTIALITTSVASVAVTYALMSSPSSQAEDLRPVASVTAPVDYEEVAAASAGEQRDLASEALGVATEVIAAASQADGAEMARAALRLGEFSRARHIAAEYYSRSTDLEALQEVFDRSLAEDPFLRPRMRTMMPDVDADLLRALGGGASVTFRFLKDGESQFAYKVNRDEWTDGWRVEVAAYLLCEMLPCGFDIPLNEPARISREDFEELYGRLNTPRQLNYAEQRFDELIWNREVGPDGVAREYLHGTLKEWIPRYVNWPVEYVDTWRPWLDLSQDESVLDEEVSEFLARIRPYGNGRFARGMAAETEDVTTRDLARQISNLSVFDYLIGNFDRFSGIEDYYGVNAHFADGRFVAIDNSAAFQFRTLNRMEPRLARIERFSRTLIDGIRLLQPEVVDPILFPDPSGRERLRLRVFWEQRDKLLAHVDALVEEYGEEAVYAFH